MIDRARYLREANWDVAARQLAARPHSFTTRPIDVEKWYELQLILARGAAADRQYTMAYNIARQVDDALPAGSDISLKPLGIRDDYTSLTWLGGTMALNYLNRPADAISLFDRYSRGGRSLQVAAKGYYWAGRAAAKAGRADATSYFQRAAAYPELFYGQLALERLGRPVPVPAGLPTMLVTDAQRTAFAQRRLVHATRRLGQSGARAEQALFVRALSETLKTEGDRVLATELATQIGRQDLAVWTARSARNSGTTFYMRPAFPTVSGGPSGRLWSLTQGITRQESSFDRTAVSGAGARGMMQLMTPTARETAGKMGIGYDSSRLTSDPAYNVMIGSYYFQRMLNTWGGSYPLAVASYNAGPGNVRKWVNAYGDPRQPGVDMIQWIEAIPITETRGYVQRVLENAVVYDRINPSGTPSTPVHISAYLGKSRPG
jgi:soluble lytic murein transglycosylase